MGGSSPIYSGSSPIYISTESRERRYAKQPLFSAVAFPTSHNAPTMRFTFKKSEHLCRLSEIERLFSAGSRSATVFPVRIVYRKVQATDGEPPVKVLVSVAKRRLHHAVDRNRAKRQLREAYRLQKSTIYNILKGEEAIHLGLIWMADKPMESHRIHTAIGTLLERVAENLKRNHQA